MTSVYCSVADVKQELRADEVLDMAQDKKIMRLIRQFSRRIDARLNVTRPFFVPVLEDRRVAIDGVNINSALNTLSLVTTQGGPSPMLDYTGSTLNGSAIAASAYPAGLFPIMALQLSGCCNTWGSLASCNGARGPQFATISGVWGFHRHYAEAWLEVDTLDGGIDDTETTITVQDIAGDTPLGESPRLSAGHVLKIDDEWLDVVSTDEATNTAVVVRGVNGSTAAAHDDEASVSVFQIEDDVRRAFARQTALMYARQGAFNTARVSQYTNADYPEDVLQEVYALLQPYANIG